MQLSKVDNHRLKMLADFHKCVVVDRQKYDIVAIYHDRRFILVYL